MAKWLVENSNVFYTLLEIFLSRLDPYLKRCAAICDKLSQLGILESRTVEENPYVIDDSVPAGEDLDHAGVAPTTSFATRNGAVLPTSVDDNDDDSNLPAPIPFPRGSSMHPSVRLESRGGATAPKSSSSESRPLPAPPAENVYEEVSLRCPVVLAAGMILNHPLLDF